MKVKDLIRHLKSVDPDMIAVMSCDPEGNHYSPLCAFGLDSKYLPSGEMCSVDEDGFEDPSAVPAVILWPMD